MTASTFIKIVRSVTDAKAVHFSSFKQSALNDLARRYSQGSLDTDQAVAELRLLFSEDFALNHHDYAAIAKKLKRS